MTGRSHESVTRIGRLPAKFEARLGAIAILRCMGPFLAHVRHGRPSLRAREVVPARQWSVEPKRRSQGDLHVGASFIITSAARPLGPYGLPSDSAISK